MSEFGVATRKNSQLASVGPLPRNPERKLSVSYNLPTPKASGEARRVGGFRAEGCSEPGALNPETLKP